MSVGYIECLCVQEFKTCGSSNIDTGKVSSNLETKYRWDEYGVTFTEKWSTDNTLGTEITVEDQVHTHTLSLCKCSNWSVCVSVLIGQYVLVF